MVQELFAVQHVVASLTVLSVPHCMVDRLNLNYLHQTHRYRLDLVVEILNKIFTEKDTKSNWIEMKVRKNKTHTIHKRLIRPNIHLEFIINSTKKKEIITQRHSLNGIFCTHSHSYFVFFIPKIKTIDRFSTPFFSFA